MMRMKKITRRNFIQRSGFGAITLSSLPSSGSLAGPEKTVANHINGEEAARSGKKILIR
jgi:hypothetical protein